MESLRLNRHWVKRGEAGGTNGSVSSVHCELFSHLMSDTFISMTCFSKLALAQWKQNSFLPLQQKWTSLTSADLKLIELDSFISLDINDSNLNKTCLDIYEKQFEVLFLDATQKFYNQDSESFLAANSLSIT